MNRTLIVVDHEALVWQDENLSFISLDTYLSDYPQLNEPQTRIINLCDTERYLSLGYYCSLLAEARSHKVLPSVKVINDLRAFGNQALISTHMKSFFGAIKSIECHDSVDLLVLLGSTDNSKWQVLAKQIFDIFQAPILWIKLSNTPLGLNVQLKCGAFSVLDPNQRQQMVERMQFFTQRDWRSPVRRKKPRWEMAILVDPKEALPPSDHEAVKRFVKAASKVGIHADVITASEIMEVSYYDALFIRETTAIDHHTYNISRQAEREGLIVIDDPASILRCSNKIFLHDAFRYNNIPSLNTLVVSSISEEEISLIERSFSYPMILKMPESAFSKGVFKIENRDALKNKLQELLQSSSLALVQEYCYTEFDWRIGVLGSKPIFACQYFMAPKHWQIFNHAAKGRKVGAYETLATFEVPKVVLDVAIKATNVVGQGLYGVDIKQKGKQAYVIEVNDNPNIDYKVEDCYLGNELYMIIMSEFSNRLENRGR